MVTTGAAYITMTSPIDDRLVAASVDPSVAASVELHETMTETTSTDATGMTAEPTMEMQATAGIALAAGKTVAMTPGGYHVMMIDLAAPLQRDSTFVMTLTFEKAGTRQVTVAVRDDAP